MEEEKKEVRILTRTERQEIRMRERLDRIEELRGEYIDDVTAYVYRETLSGENTSLPPVRGVLADHELGLLYGPGKYKVVYRYLDLDNEEGKEKYRSTSVQYSIGPEYGPLHREDCAMHGRPCYLDVRAAVPGIAQGQNNGLSDLLTEEKIKGIVALLGAFKMMIGNDRGSDELRYMLAENTKLLQSAIAGRSQPSNDLGSRLIEQMLPRMLEHKEVNPMQQLGAQIEMFGKLQELTNPQIAQQRREEEEVKNQGPFAKLIDKAMDMLPAFLERFNGDEVAAAKAVKSENIMASMMLKNEDAQKAFYAATSRKYGQTAADKWAYGFGINPEKFRPNVQTVPAAQQAPASSKGSLNLG